ncbi:MAG: peptide-modifying radical SAM enzyme CbpB [bacterium]|nr:peptide-modifying radical SAM enzyme CbpB [bacterium]
MKKQPAFANKASSRGLHFNTGNGPSLIPVDIGHEQYVGLVDPDTAFWSLAGKETLADVLASGGSFMKRYMQRRASFVREMEALRFGLKPTAVYFNPTDRCNLNCSYCYIPEDMRRNGVTMSPARLLKALGKLKDYFAATVPKGMKPQIVFHGAEPLIAREALFAGIDAYRDDFRFGVQTNGTLLDEETTGFLTSRGIGIGLSLDAHVDRIASRTRKTWAGASAFDKVIEALARLKGYPNYNVICTVTRENMRNLVKLVEYFHAHEVPVCMLNPVRCTRQGARDVRPADHELSKHYLGALDRTWKLFRETGRKLVVANFANMLVSIIAPTARRLMCDISPCGGGRCFFAVSASGGLFPCSEFVGVEQFEGGNLFRGSIEKALASKPFQLVTGRKVEAIDPCRRCAVRHFCGAPCLAEAFEMNGGMDRPGAFCELYEEQVRYALRLIADGKHNDYLWDGWDDEATTTFDITA